MTEDDGTQPFGDHGETEIEPIGIIDGDRIEDLNTRWRDTGYPQ